MALFEAHGWDSGVIPVASAPAQKRKRDNTDSDPSNDSQPKVNLDKLMNKMRLESAKAARKAKAPNPNGANAGSGPSAPKRKRKERPPPQGKMDPPESTPGPRMRREDSDVFPPSSAGDDDPTTTPSLATHLKKKRKTKTKTKADIPHEPMEVDSSPSKRVDNDSSASEFSGLTKMQREMKQKLSGGRFRMINELLYKSESADAHDMMRRDPTVYEEYHTGFRNQVQSWPTNPVAYYTEQILASSPQETVIADLGCGDAALARALVPRGFRVLSFDLVSDGEYVVEADICEKVPLPGSEIDAGQGGASVVDVCVFALSLMGLNWIRSVREARRVLKTGGVLKIAEVTSRFTDVKAFKSVVTSLGFEFVSKEEPSTHFVLFEFRRTPRLNALGKKDMAVVETRAKDLLKPCEYKRR